MCKTILLVFTACPKSHGRRIRLSKCLGNITLSTTPNPSETRADIRTPAEIAHGVKKPAQPKTTEGKDKTVTAWVEKVDVKNGGSLRRVYLEGYDKFGEEKAEAMRRELEACYPAKDRLAKRRNAAGESPTTDDDIIWPTYPTTADEKHQAPNAACEGSKSIYHVHVPDRCTNCLADKAFADLFADYDALDLKAAASNEDDADYSGEYADLAARKEQIKRQWPTLLDREISHPEAKRGVVGDERGTRGTGRVRVGSKLRNETPVPEVPEVDPQDLVVGEDERQDLYADWSTEPIEEEQVVEVVEEEAWQPAPVSDEEGSADDDFWAGRSKKKSRVQTIAAGVKSGMQEWASERVSTAGCGGEKGVWETECARLGVVGAACPVV